MDVVEVAPAYDQSGITAPAAATAGAGNALHPGGEKGRIKPQTLTAAARRTRSSSMPRRISVISCDTTQYRRILSLPIPLTS